MARRALISASEGAEAALRAQIAKLEAMGATQRRFIEQMHASDPAAGAPQPPADEETGRRAATTAWVQERLQQLSKIHHQTSC